MPPKKIGSSKMRLLLGAVGLASAAIISVQSIAAPTFVTSAPKVKAPDAPAKTPAPPAATTPAPPTIAVPGPQENKPAPALSNWQEARQLSIDFLSFSPQTRGQKTPDAAKPSFRAVLVETIENPLEFGIWSYSNSYDDNRHLRASSISLYSQLGSSAAQGQVFSIPGYSLQAVRSDAERLRADKFDTPAAPDFLLEANIISSSEMLTGADRAYDSKALRQLFSESVAIITQAAGNNGHLFNAAIAPTDRGYGYGGARVDDFADTALIVGENEDCTVAEHSSRRVSVIVQNPYHPSVAGPLLQTDYYRSYDAFQLDLNQNYLGFMQQNLGIDQNFTKLAIDGVCPERMVPLHGELCVSINRAGAVAYNALAYLSKVVPDKEAELAAEANALRGGFLDVVGDTLERSDIPAITDWTKTTAVPSLLRTLPQILEHRDALIALAMRDYFAMQVKQNALDGTTVDLRGTSFSAPALAGQLARQFDQHKKMHPYTAYAAALLAAMPLKQRMNEDVPEKLTTIVNAAGRTFAPHFGGFGLVDSDRLDALLGAVPQNAWQAEGAVRPIWPEVAGALFDGSWQFSLPVENTNNGLALRVQLSFSTALPAGTELTLVSPKGTRIPLDMGSYVEGKADKNNSSIGVSEGFIGEPMTGTWRVVASSKKTTLPIDITKAGLTAKLAVVGDAGSLLPQLLILAKDKPLPVPAVCRVSPKRSGVTP